VINSWRSRGATTDQVTLPLTAGKHTLRVDYFNAGTGRAMKLEWGGAVNRAVIPTVQFEPLPLPPEDGVFWTTGEWQGRTVNAQRLGYHTTNANNAITIASAGGDMAGSVENFHYVWQNISGDFIFDTKVDMDLDPLRPGGKAMLMVRSALSAGSPFLAVCAISTNQNGRFNIKHRIPPETNVSDALTAWQDPSALGLETFHLRIKRVKDTFSFAYSLSGSSWTPLDYEYTGGAFGKDIHIGMAVCADIQSSQQMFQTATFSEISLKKLNGTVLLLK